MSNRIILSILVFVFFMSGAFATQAAERLSFVERPENEFLILGLEINGFSRTEGMEAYLPEQSSPGAVLIPLGALSRAMSYAIKVNPGDGIAEGWFLQEDHIFQLDLIRQQVIVAGKTRPLSDGGVEAHVDDIYVRADLLSDWFDLDISMDMGTLILSVSSGESLPFQEKILRQQKAKTLLDRFSYKSFDPKKANLLPYKMISLPSFMLTQSLTAISTPEERRYQSVSNIQTNMDVLKFGADLNLSYKADNGTKEEIQTARLTFQRRDPGRNMLGLMRAGKLSFGDINFSPVPLFTGRKSGAGVSVSSDPELGFKFIRGASDFVMDGDAPPGWDAELYRNGNFIGFQTIDGSGRFNFESVDLVDGYNLFQIILYGPEGQKRTVTREVFRGANMLEPDETVYDVAIGRPQADFLPLAENYREDDRLGISGQVFHGINNFLTVGSSFYSGPNDEANDRAATFTVASAFLGLNTQAQALFANDSRRGYELSARMRPFGVNATLTHTMYQNFMEDDQELEKVTELSLSRNFGSINATLNGKKRTFINRENDFILENILSADLFGIKFTNELTKIFSKDEQIKDFDGELTALGDIGDIRLRGSLAYELNPDSEERFRTLRLNAQKNLSDGSSVRLNGNYEFASNVTSMDARYSREFGPFAMDFSVGATSTESYSVGIGIRTGLQPSSTKRYGLVNSQQAAQASLGVRAYIDKNSNDVFDPDEQALENIQFRASRGGIQATTNEAGVGWLYGMVEMPTQVSVNKEAIPSIYLVPAKESLNLIPRRGANAVVDYAFIQLGEIDGFIMGQLLGGESMALSNIPVRLIDVGTGKEIGEINSEYDGYYVFSALPLGSYKIVASTGWFEEGIADTTETTLDLTSDKPTRQDVNLVLAMVENTDADNTGDTLQTVEPQAGDEQDLAEPLFILHLASFKTEKKAQQEIKRLKEQYDILANLPLHTEKSEVRPGEFYQRVLSDPLPQSKAKKICSILTSSALPDGCILLEFPKN